MSECGKCSLAVSGRDKGVLCEICEVWFHAKCQGISDEAYKILQKEQSLHWYCKGCEKGMAKILETVTRIQKRQDQLEDEMLKMVTSMNEMKARLNEVTKDSSEIKEELKKLDIELKKSISDKLAEQKIKQEEMLTVAVQEQVTKQMNQVEGKLTAVKSSLDEVRSQAIQERDREGRACNIIVYNVPESKQKEKEHRWSEDRSFCLEVFNKVLGLSIREEDMKRFLRLGKAEDKQERPVLIQFRDRVLKNMVLDSLNRLRDTEDRYRRLIFAHDMTKEDRAECKQLVEEAKKKEHDDPSGEFIYRVRGPPGHLRIEKIRKRH